ncbi:hypothetical protein [Nostoc sp. T09]|uniref:hypothetical protein n=1 Tax=Nostoc sp. T09 TaxID=1932621 RepID=UPI0015C4F593|nr:hypothetical protein [Nostoc sp. T09]
MTLPQVYTSALGALKLSLSQALKSLHSRNTTAVLQRENLHRELLILLNNLVE